MDLQDIEFNICFIISLLLLVAGRQRVELSHPFFFFCFGGRGDRGVAIIKG